MAVIVLRRFGGMAPSANIKAVDDSVALYARNLDLRFTDFRPLPQAEAFGAATPGGTLYRFETWGYFITKPGVVNFVRGPVPNDTFEKTYYTGDGVPKVIDATNNIRQLGVPQPAAAPTVEVNPTDQYGEVEAAAALGTKLSEFISVVWENCENPYVGPLDAELTDFEDGSEPWVFGFRIAGALTDGAFIPTNPNHAALMDSQTGYHQGLIGEVAYGFADVHLRGAILLLGDGMAAALADIDDPSDLTGTDKLLTAEQVTAIMSDLNSALIPAHTSRDATIGRIKQLKDEYVELANTGSSASTSAIQQTKNFYLRTDVATKIEEAIQQVATNIQASMITYSTSDGNYPIP